MPKKRHPAHFTKPPSVASPALSLSNPSSQPTPAQPSRSVNQILSNLRLSSGSPSGPSNAARSQLQAGPSVPPELRQILQIPETPAPPPRHPAHRNAVRGRRQPPGPATPVSWTLGRAVGRDTLISTFGDNTIQLCSLPGIRRPGDRSLMDTGLRCLAADWAQQRHLNRFHLYTLPSHMRTWLLTYVSEFYEPGLTPSDLRLVLCGPTQEELAEHGLEPPDYSRFNADLRHLDLSCSVAKSLTVKQLSEVLSPAHTAPHDQILDSWDAEEPSAGLPQLVLPNLTHLSLAVQMDTEPLVSWRHLLTLGDKIPALTHLSIAGWPVPSLTPNAKSLRAKSPITVETMQHPATGPSRQTPRDDWTEAAVVLRRFSKAFYRLEHLDLTGCADWWAALSVPVAMGHAGSGSDEDNDWPSDGDNDRHSHGDDTLVSSASGIDWRKDWGKMAFLRMKCGWELPENYVLADNTLRYVDWILDASRVGQHVRAQRSGKGPWLEVEKDSASDEDIDIASRERIRQRELRFINPATIW